MTVKQLIKTLKKMPQNAPVYHCGGPWSCPWEIELVTRDKVKPGYGRRNISVVMLDDDVPDM